MGDSYLDLKKRELEIMNQVMAGDERAIDEFHQLFHKLIRSMTQKAMAKFLDHYSQDDVEEGIAYVWTVIFKNNYDKLRRWNPERGYSISTWIGMLAKNATYDYLKYRKNFAEIPPDSAVTYEDVASDQPDVYDIMEKKEQQKTLKWAIAQLPPADRKFVELWLADELTASQIAHEVCMSVPAVYSRKNIITQKIKNIIEGVPDEKDNL